MDLVARVSVVDAGVAAGLVVTDLVAPDLWPARAAVDLLALLVLGDASVAARLAVRANPRARRVVVVGDHGERRECEDRRHRRGSTIPVIGERSTAASGLYF